MPSKPHDRSARSYFGRLKDLLIGGSKPCDRFDTFEQLHQAVGSPSPSIHNPAFKCLYDRYLQEAQHEARRVRLLDEEQAAEALDSVFVTMHQRIGANQLRLTNELHMRRYIRLGLRFQLITKTTKEGRMPMTHADDLDPLLVEAGVQIESELAHLMANETVATALQAITPDCQQKLLLWQMGYSQSEIGEQLGIKKESVKASIYQCRLRLRAELLKLGTSPGADNNPSVPPTFNN